MNLFETKISYDRISERGAVETVTEYYVFEAETFGDAENKVIEIAEQHVKYCRLGEGYHILALLLQTDKKR